MKCIGCQKQPHELSEYVQQATVHEMSPVEYVRMDEGTYDIKTDMFCCTGCYVQLGLPLNTQLIGMYQHAAEAH
ncbi:hypothetical protein MUO14_23955 [Halobacillus shinanisalinarum]|uniref:Uncharacterized protein n=1 Tax=Halobacillus shinanisalinarum TaxID=2932258 RepID=A0ABY4GYW6_9BACI|nr:hypothetical protein [Halobacillus shinanisalinarum]UOQ93386.1 hypothetical protein MUO14_23955 [Halobacillus shinanisalinarum]